MSRGSASRASSSQLLRLLRDPRHETNDNRTRFSVDWDLEEFTRYNYTGHVDLASVISISSDSQKCEASTVGDYMVRTWPTSAQHFTRAMQEWWEQISNGGSEDAFKRSILGGEVAFAKETTQLLIDVTGPLFLKMDVGEQLAWLGCVCRKGLFPDRLTSVNSSIARATDEGALGTGATLNICFSSEEFVHEPAAVAFASQCWLRLFRNPCVASGVPVGLRQEEEEGLEIPLAMMAKLSGIDRVANYEGQLVLKGFETIFVPIRKTDTSIVWHLITKPNGRKISYNAMNSVVGKAYPNVSMQDLFDSRHLLGWASNISQHAGTEDGEYEKNKDVYLESPRQGLVLSAATINVSKIIGFGASITPGRQDRNVRTASREMCYPEVVEKMTKMLVLLYDHDGGRGWLLDTASALLHTLRFHVARYRPILEGNAFKIEQFRYANPKAGVASARDVLLDDDVRRLVLLRDMPKRSEKRVTETMKDVPAGKAVVEDASRETTIEDRVLDLWAILEDMYDKWKGRKNAPGVALETLNMKLEGWRFQDIVESEPEMEPVVARLPLDGSADDWLRMIRHINAIVLIGNGFGEIMKPMGEVCTTWKSVPQRKYCLAVPVVQLRRIARKHWDPDTMPIKLAPDVYWPISEHPFACTCESSTASAPSACNRSQTLRGNGRVPGIVKCDILNAPEHDHGAVIFGGRKVNKQQAAEDSSATQENKNKAKTGWLHRFYDRIRKRKGK